MTQAQGYGYGSMYPQGRGFNKADLSRAVLAELPDQLVFWMRKLAKSAV